MSTKESVDKVTGAISEFQKATVPVVREIIGLLDKNTDQMSANSRQLLEIVNKNLDNVAGSASRLAASSTQLLATVFDRTETPKRTAK